MRECKFNPCRSADFCMIRRDWGSVPGKGPQELWMDLLHLKTSAAAFLHLCGAVDTECLWQNT